MKRTPAKPPKATVVQRLFEPVDASSLVFFRVSFGLLMLWHLREFLLADKVRIFTEPSILFKFHGFEWVHPGPAWAMKLFFWVLGAAALGIAVGFLYRLSAAVFFLGSVYVLLLEAALVNNHDYLISLLAFLLIFTPVHRCRSADAARRPQIRSPTVPAWALWLLRFQIGVPYFFGGLAKINGDWLLRAQPMTLWLQEGGAGGDFLPESFKTPLAGYFFSWGGFLLDLLIVPLLLWPRTRLAAYLATVAFHLTNAQIFTIGVFPWLMICATTIFFPPDWPQRIGLLRRRGAAAGKRRRPHPGVPEAGQRLTAGLLAAFVAIQVLLPFRHFLYPGNVDWTDEGIFFAWRMKLRDKYGDVKLVVLDTKTKKATVLDDFDSVLTPRQYRHMVHDPDMLLQFAHHVARQLRDQGRRDFEIRAVTRIAFNGREPRPLVDPTVDLAAQPRRLPPASWILPLADGAR